MVTALVAVMLMLMVVLYNNNQNWYDLSYFTWCVAVDKTFYLPSHKVCLF